MCFCKCVGASCDSCMCGYYIEICAFMCFLCAYLEAASETYNEVRSNPHMHISTDTLVGSIRLGNSQGGSQLARGVDGRSSSVCAT